MGLPMRGCVLTNIKGTDMKTINFEDWMDEYFISYSKGSKLLALVSETGVHVTSSDLTVTKDRLFEEIQKVNDFSPGLDIDEFDFVTINNAKDSIEAAGPDLLAAQIKALVATEKAVKGTKRNRNRNRGRR